MDKYTTSKGYEIEFFGVATKMDRLQASRKIPQIPTYQVPLAGGGFEIHEHEDYVDKDGKLHTTLNTDEEKAAWADYIKARDAEIAEFNKHSLMTMLLEGIRVANKPSDEQIEKWARRQHKLGIDIPDDPDEREFLWVYTEVVSNLAELNTITEGVKDASGVSEERLSQTADSFRRPLGREETKSTESDNGNRTLDVLSEIRTGESGNQNANDNEPVRRTKRGR